jgi:membrane protein DedA with SNARE-associated domain
MVIEQIHVWVSDYGYAMIFSLLMLGVLGLPIPDETLLTLAGYLVYRGDLALIPAFFSAFLGSICGISVSYGLGRIGGFYLIERWGRKVHVTTEKLILVERWFDRAGKWALTFGYFLPGIRHLTAVVAGASRLPWKVFAVFAYSGGFLWSVTFIAAGYFMREAWAEMSGEMHRLLVTISGAILVLLISFALIRGKKKLLKWDLRKKQ